MSSAPFQVPLRRPEDSLPARLCAGDQHAWTVQTRLPQGTFLFYILTGVVGNTPVRIALLQPTGTAPALSGGVQVDAQGVAAFSVASPITAKWQPGRYQWVLFALDPAGDRQQIAQGEIRIEPDPLSAVPADPRSENEKLLGAIRSLLQNKALDDAQMYKIGTRELTKMEPRDLLYWEGVVEARVRREYRRKKGKSGYRQAPVIFGGR